MHKRVLDSFGKVIHEYDGLSGTTANQNEVYEQTVQALKNSEGCQLEGNVAIHKVPGNFHISSHNFAEAWQKLYFSGYTFGMKHKINHLSFGDRDEIGNIKQMFGKTMTNELNGQTINTEIRGGQLFVQYNLDITEAEFEDMSGPVDQFGNRQKYSAFEYRSMKSIMATGHMASVWFQYNITPVKVHYTMYHETLAEFLVRFSAIIGGMFAAAGIMESMLRNGFCLVFPGANSQADGPSPKRY